MTPVTLNTVRAEITAEAAAAAAEKEAVAKREGLLKLNKLYKAIETRLEEASALKKNLKAARNSIDEVSDTATLTSADIDALIDSTKSVFGGYANGGSIDVLVAVSGLKSAPPMPSPHSSRGW